MKMNINFSIPVSVFKEGEVFIAHSPVLDLSTSADNFEAARKRFEEVVQIFFEEIMEAGTLEQVLSDLGWQKVQRQWQPPVLISQEREKFDFKFS